METVELKSSGFAAGGSIFSLIMGWISVATLTDAIIIAFVSTIIGFYSGKLIKWIDNKIKDWIIERNKRKKAQ